MSCDNMRFLTQLQVSKYSYQIWLHHNAMPEYVVCVLHDSVLQEYLIFTRLKESSDIIALS